MKKMILAIGFLCMFSNGAIAHEGNSLCTFLAASTDSTDAVFKTTVSLYDLGCGETDLGVFANERRFLEYIYLHYDLADIPTFVAKLESLNISYLRTESNEALATDDLNICEYYGGSSADDEYEYSYKIKVESTQTCGARDLGVFGSELDFLNTILRSFPVNDSSKAYLSLRKAGYFKSTK